MQDARTRFNELTRATELFQQGHLDQALTYTNAILPKYPREAVLFNVLGGISMASSDWGKAEKHFTKATKIEPRNVDFLRNLATAQKYLKRLVQAERNLLTAVKVSAKFADGWNSLGLVYLEKGDPDKAHSAFRTGFKAQPDSVETATNYLVECEHANEPKLLDAALADFKTLLPRADITTLIKGLIAHRSKDFEAAAAHLAAISFGPNTPTPQVDLELLRVGNLAKTYDKLGQHRAAFDTFTLANRLNIARTPPQEFKPKAFDALVDSRLEYFSMAKQESWTQIETSDATPVFMIGFPRSGTTLLDTFLRGHGDIAMIEEKPLVDALVANLGTVGVGNISALAAVTDKTAKMVSNGYLKSLRKHADGQPVVIDRMPFNLAHIGEILRIFPNAKFILAVRDPADIVLSCFMQSFGLEGAMASMTTPETTAVTFDKLFRLWQVFLDTHDFQHIVCRYEDVVNDPEATLKPIVEFLGLNWDAKLLNHQKTASARSHINTASAGQVTQPIYKSSVKRWHNYADFMPEALETLKFWREYFGYSDER